MSTYYKSSLNGIVLHRNVPTIISKEKVSNPLEKFTMGIVPVKSFREPELWKRWLRWTRWEPVVRGIH